jgi:MFS family permease
MGYSSLHAQALSAPPYLFAFVVVLLTAYASDRSRSRSSYLIAHALISSLSYFAIAATGYFHSHLPTWLHTFIRYICVYPATAGFFSAITLIITWSMDNRVEKEGKGASIAILNIIGQCGPLLGTRLYPESDGPWYVRGMATCSFFMVVVAILAVGLRITLQRMNRAAAETTYTIIEHAGPVDRGEERDELMGGGRRNDLDHSSGDRRLAYII